MHCKFIANLTLSIVDEDATSKPQTITMWPPRQTTLYVAADAAAAMQNFTRNRPLLRPNYFYAELASISSFRSVFWLGEFRRQCPCSI